MLNSIKISSLLLKAKDNLFILLILIPALLYLFIFFILVSFFLFSQSFSSGMPFFALWKNPEFIPALVRTLWFVGLGAPLQLVAGLILALLVYQSIKGVGMIRSIFMLPIAIPALVSAICLNILFSYPFGHINDLLLGRHSFFPQLIKTPINWGGSEFLSLLLALGGKVWRDMPISMLIILAGLQSIEKEKYETAQTLGASRWQQFKYITFPLLLPAILSVLVLRSVECWKEFIFPFVIAPSYPVLGVLIERLYHAEQNPQEGAAAALFLVILIAGTAVIFTQGAKFLRKRMIRV
ncbi:MAG TPA: sugar ABC transporter permease [candidate division Zixibacteria bacterium]